MVLEGKVVSCKLHCWLPIVSFMINVNSQIFKPFEMHVKGKIINHLKWNVEHVDVCIIIYIMV